MFDNLILFRMAGAMAAHAGTRQAVVAQNIANADTPGYRPRDVLPFAEALRQHEGRYGIRATRPGHLNGVIAAQHISIDADPEAEAEPNGNRVSLERQMLNAADVKRQHDRALAIYRSGLSILRGSLGRGG